MFTKATTKRIGAFLASGLLAVSLTLPVGAPRTAQADELSDAKAALDSASSQLSVITAEYNQLQAQAADLESRIAETTQNVMEAQSAMVSGQELLGQTVRESYKNESMSSLANVFLMSTDLDSFLKNLDYYNAIQEDQAEQVATQKQLRDAFTAALEDLDAQKDQQQQLLDAAAAKKTEAERVVADASSKVSSIESEQARLAELQAQAAALQEQQSKKAEATVSPSWNTSSGTGGSEQPETPASASSANSGSSSNNASNGSSSKPADSQSGWRTGVASAYGGSSDKSTPNPGVTALGAICNDSSWGVAVPMSWPNYRSYLGRSVEIKYGGKTVVATVNDCGYMGGGSRSLDLQPGVFKAFGFSTCQAWGLRTVSYRFL